MHLVVTVAHSASSEPLPVTADNRTAAVMLHRQRDSPGATGPYSYRC